MLTFYPFLFDSYDAWKKTIEDPNYSYDMSFNDFMLLYQKYREINKEPKTTFQSVSKCVFEKLEETIKKPKETKNEQMLLSQEEIDNLFSIGLD